MSYDIMMFRTEVREHCRANNINVGQLLEEQPNFIPDFTQPEKDLIKKYLENHDYTIESQDSKMIAYAHKSHASVSATLRENTLSFCASLQSSAAQWELFETSMGIMDESHYKLTRFDFQDGRWD